MVREYSLLLSAYIHDTTRWISLSASPYLLESSELLENLVPLLLAVYDFLTKSTHSLPT